MPDMPSSTRSARVSRIDADRLARNADDLPRTIGARRASADRRLLQTPPRLTDLSTHPPPPHPWERARLARVFPSITPGSARVPPACPSLQGEVFREAPACHLPFPGIRTPNLPLLPVWEKGAGGMRGKRRGNAENHSSLSRNLPLRAPASPFAAR